MGRNRGRTRTVADGTFLQVVGSMKLSGLFRRMQRASKDKEIQGPPAFFTRRRDGIPVPALAEFMKG